MKKWGGVSGAAVKIPAMHTITIASRKGGVGKTTTALALSAELARRAANERQLRVLTVDCDPQGSLTLASGVPEPVTDAGSLHGALCPSSFTDAGAVSVSRAYWGGDLIPSSLGLANAEEDLLAEQDGAYRLRALLQQLADDYDYCVIDSPPSLGLLGLNTLTAADSVLIPITPDWFAAGALARMTQLIGSMPDHISMDVIGVFPTMVRRTAHAQDLCRGLSKELGPLWLDVKVPQSVGVQYAQQLRIPLWEWDARAPVTRAYVQLANEVERRIHGLKAAA